MDKNSPEKENENKNETNTNENKNIIKDHKYYNQLVKTFMNINIKDQEYIDKIEKYPDKLFILIDQNIVSDWEQLLQNKKSNEGIDNSLDSKIDSVERDTEFQVVIKNDCNRTRVRESIFVDNFKQTLENILTYYCKSKNIYYKQGLNEIFGPLLLMKYKYKELKLSTILSLGESFIDKFLPNYFYEKELYSLKSSLGLLLILIKYHEPSVYNRLDSMEIIPEMYATNWVMTYAFGKLKLDILYNLWDYIIRINDPLFLHFYFVAMIINRRELIINCEKHLLPTLMASLTIISNDELNIVVEKAKELRYQTPFSFRILANKLGFLVAKNKSVKEKFERYKPLSLPAMPIFPLEVLYITNGSEIECPDEECKISKKMKNNNKYGFEVVNKKEVSQQKYKCEKCDLKIEKKIKFFLLDLRILEYGLNKEENESDKTGYLPLMINVNQDELKSEEINEIISKRYINERGLFHFIFLTTNTDAFLNFEEMFYKTNISEEDEKKIMFGLMEKKTEKEFNFDSKKITKKQIFKLKEYDNLRKILKSLKEQNYPYIGFVYGGFDLIHKKSIEYNAELLFHNEKTCILCNHKNNQKEKEKEKVNVKNEKEIKEKDELYNKLWEHKKRIKYEKLNEIYNLEVTPIYIGSLIKYKNKNLGSEKVQILVIVNSTNFIIEIYKFPKSEIDLISKKGYYGLGIGIEKKETELILIEEIKITAVMGLNIEKKTKNIVNFTIIDKNKEIENNKKNKNKENNIINRPTFDIVIDFSSSHESKKFICHFKEMSIKYKNQKNQKNK